jgi:hypothetical protein
MIVTLTQNGGVTIYAKVGWTIRSRPTKGGKG